MKKTGDIHLSTLPKRTLKAIAYVVFLLVAVFILSEIVLRMWDPFGFTQSEKEIILPRNKKIIFTNTKIPVLDRTIIHTKNSLGFRGPEPPADLQQHTSIIAVGGSTTECFYLDDSSCWTNHLSNYLSKKISDIWINNAGFRGHSTFGNYILVKDVIIRLKPKYVLLMEGINEIDRDDISRYETLTRKNKNAWDWLKARSRLINILTNMKRHFMAEHLGVIDNYFNAKDAKMMDIPQRVMDSILKKQAPLVEAYSKRMTAIIDTCLDNRIRPILITQALLYGGPKDCVTGTDLQKIESTDRYNGELMWKLLELYNAKTRAIARQRNLMLVDLANELPKCSLYFYDMCHFTKEGSVMVGNILGKHIEAYLEK